jgi:hypothetical protein
MESGRIPDDRPYLRPIEPPLFEGAKWWVIPVVVLAGAAIAYYFWQEGRHAYLPVPPPRTESTAAAPAVSAVPAIRHPLEANSARHKASELPELRSSDAPVWAALKGLCNERSLVAHLYSDRIILRIVATIDNLPRKTAPARMMPAKPVPGAFETTRSGTTPVIATANSARYRPYVRFAQSIDAGSLVYLYAHYYPLFQKAYSELGYPKGYFNDRLLEAIDDLLEAPALKAPVRLAQRKVLYEFEADDLEARSAGQKILMRMGSDNAATVMSNLREIRAALIARAEKR